MLGLSRMGHETYPRGVIRLPRQQGKGPRAWTPGALPRRFGYGPTLRLTMFAGSVAVVTVKNGWNAVPL